MILQGETWHGLSIAKSFKPDVVILDMGDKFAKTAGFARQDEALKANAVHARMIAKQYNCAIFYMSQLSAEASKVSNQAMMEGSRAARAAEADICYLPRTLTLKVKRNNLLRDISTL